MRDLADGEVGIFNVASLGRIGIWARDGSAIVEITLSTGGSPGGGGEAPPAGDYRMVADEDYVCLPDDAQIGIAPLTQPRTVTLPRASVYPELRDLVISDLSGSCSGDLTITVRVDPDSGDTLAGYGSFVLDNPYQSIRLRRGTANLWIEI